MRDKFNVKSVWQILLVGVISWFYQLEILANKLNYLDDWSTKKSKTKNHHMKIPKKILILTFVSVE